MTYEIDLTGHRALVTGGGQGVGEEIARTLAQAGAEVLVNDLVAGARRSGWWRRSRPTAASARPAVFDVTDYDAVVPRSTDGGPVDILVNNAGNAGRATTMGMEDLATLVRDRPVGLGGVHQGQLLRRDVRGARRAAGDDRRGVGPCRHRDLGHRPGGRDPHGRVFGGQGGRGRLLSFGRARGRASRHHRQLRRPRHHEHARGSPPEEDARDGATGQEYVIRRRGLPERRRRHGHASSRAPQAEWITGQTYPVNGGYSFTL